MRPGQFPAHPLWWEIVYVGGGRVRGSSAEEWATAPAEGVLVVRQPMRETYGTPDGGRFHFTARCHSRDYYWLTADGFIQCGNAPLAVGAVSAKRGAWAERDEFRSRFAELGADALADERVG